jgi:S1-C subfamily serine protease
VQLSGVRPGSPAERAGLRAGDTIVRFGGVRVTNLEDLVYALRAKRAGDTVEVVYRRDGQEQASLATLEQRR